MPEELDDLPAELGEGLVVPVVGDVFVHQGPQPFDGIEMGTVGRKEAQNDFAPGLRKPLLDDAGFVIIESVFGLAARRTKASRSSNWSGPRR